MTKVLPAPDTDSEPRLVPLVLSLDEARACASAAHLGGRVEIVRPVRWIPAHTGMPKAFLHDFSRAWVDPGLHRPDDPHQAAYLKVPVAHPGEGWDHPRQATVRGPVGVGDVFWGREPWRPCLPDVIEYRADGQRIALKDAESSGIVWRNRHWRPAIQMRLCASRLRLPVESVAVERAEGPDAPESGWRWRWGCRVELVDRGSVDPAVGPAASASRVGGQQGRGEGR